MTKQTTHPFRCGHEQVEPLYMGRGKARQRRLAIYFSRLCSACLQQHIERQADEYNEVAGKDPVSGKFLLRKLTPEEKTAYIAKRIKAQIDYKY